MYIYLIFIYKIGPMNHLRKLLFYLQSGLDREAQNILLGT